MLTRLSQNTLTLLSSNLGGALLLFVLSAMIGRTLGSAGLGVYAVALAWVYPLSLLVEFGLTTLMTREISANIDQLPTYMESITLARLLIGGTVLIALYVAAPHLSADPVIVVGLQVTAPLVIIQPFYSQFTTAFKVRGFMWTIPALNLGMIGAQVLLTALILASGGTVLHALILNTITSAVQLVAAWCLYQAYVRRDRLHSVGSIQSSGRDESRPYNDIRLLALLRAALPFALAAVFAALQARMVFFLLEHQVMEAGYFSAANRFIEAAKLLPNAFFAALFPLIGSASVRGAFRPATLGLAAFGFSAGIGFTVTAPFLLTLVFGADFLPAAPTLIVLGWSLIFFGLRGNRTIYWYAHGGEHFVNGVNALAVVAIFLLGLGLIPLFGAFGGAVAVLLTELGVTTLLYARKGAEL